MMIQLKIKKKLLYSPQNDLNKSMEIGYQEWKKLVSKNISS